MYLKILTFLLIAFASTMFNHAVAQLVINEASNRNNTQILDEDGESKDWFELYNAGDEIVNLSGWTITDDSTEKDKWAFPFADFNPKSHLLVFASGKDRKGFITGDKWESAILASDTFQYKLPDITTPGNWNTLAFDASAWESGQASFGYGDGDDSTLVPDGTRVIYIRKTFTIPDTSALINAICHMDFDDGFVAYLNGVEICRNNISGTPTWESFSANQHDAVMFNGGPPNEFLIDRELLSSAWNQGENVFAAEVHNVNTTSSDLTLIPFLTFAIVGDETFFSPTPWWFSNSLETNLHTNFKLSSTGETLYLYNRNIFEDSLRVDRTEIDYSIGRASDGADEIAIFATSTPRKTNNTSTPYLNGYEVSPYFSKAAGFYSDSIEVTIHAGSTTADIYYTSDGSEPTTASIQFEGDPIRISRSTVLRARCYSTIDKLPGITNSVSYFIDEEYSIPVLSVITDRTNLFGSTGIFTNYNELWNKPCFVEYFDTLKNLAFRQEAGIQVDGGAGGSRSQPQTSFRIEPGHGTFGADDLNYKLQPDRPEREIYSSFYVRNGSNQYLILPHKDGAEVKGMGKNTYNFYSAYRPIAVHINGEVWIGNNDWPQNNIKIWRCASTNYRWQFALVDLEWALRPHEWTTSTLFRHGLLLAYSLLPLLSFKYGIISSFISHPPNTIPTSHPSPGIDDTLINPLCKRMTC